jgi:Ras GTPase-activating protein 1
MVITGCTVCSFTLKDHPPPAVGRDLTLIAKILQNLANLVVFGKKEVYMEPCNEWILKQQPKMKIFLDSLSQLPTSRT